MARAKVLKKVSTTTKRDKRLPSVGSVLTREHDGKVIRVKVLKVGFEWNGVVYKSLSKIAREATGTNWNGYLFFHLTPYPVHHDRGAAKAVS